MHFAHMWYPDSPDKKNLFATVVVNGLPVRFLEKAGLGFDFTKTQLTGTVLGL